MASLVSLASLISLSGCGDKAGEDGTEILIDFNAMHGGAVFATAAIVGAHNYDLYWVPVPSVPTTASFEAHALTNSGGKEWQPSVSRGGSGIAYARDDGIYFIATSGRIRQISHTDGTGFHDSLPAVSFDGSEVAWVRENSKSRIGDSRFFETMIMVAPTNGGPAQAVNPRPGVVQDAPAFEPLAGSRRIAWSEFNAQTLGPQGPIDYGVYVHDRVAATGRYLCKQGDLAHLDGLRAGRSFRCFGQHLTWPCPEAIVLPQDFIELYLDGSPATTILPEVVTAAVGNLGDPVLSEPGDGFYPAFPLSASYASCTDRFIFDGLLTSPEGEAPTLSLFVAQVDGGGLFTLNVRGHSADLDTFNTSNYLFSVATPQFVP